MCDVCMLAIWDGARGVDGRLFWIMGEVQA